jgi:hypothetical protein
MSEKKLNQDLIKFFKKESILYERIENSVGVGTPDFAFFINGLNGFIECKYTTDKKGKISLRHWTKNQRTWFVRRPSNVNFLLIRCGDLDYFLSSYDYIYFQSTFKDFSAFEDLDVLSRVSTVVNLKKLSLEDRFTLKDMFKKGVKYACRN